MSAPKGNPPDLAAARTRLAQLEARLAHPPAPDAFADGLQGERELEADKQAWRDEIARTRLSVTAMAARRDADLAKLHIWAKALHHDATIRSAQCLRVSGGRSGSSGDLSEPERGVLLAELTAAMKAAGLWGRRGQRRVRSDSAAAPKDAIAGKIRALLLDAGRDDRYANSIALSRWKVTRWEWLTYPALHALMQMLEIDAERRAVGAALANLAARRPPLIDLTPYQRRAGLDLRVLATLESKHWALSTDGTPDGWTLLPAGLREYERRQAKAAAKAAGTAPDA